MHDYHLPQRDYYSGFSNRETFKRKVRRDKFKPTEEQVQAAKGRVLGVINRYRGCYYTDAGSIQLLAKEMVSKVYCRGGSLGNTSKDIQATLSQAIAELIKEQQLDFRPEDGICMTRGHNRPRKQHRDKFAGQRRRNMARIA